LLQWFCTNEADNDVVKQAETRSITWIQDKRQQLFLCKPDFYVRITHCNTTVCNKLIIISSIQTA